MKKVYQALTDTVVRKQWIGDSDQTPEGWFSAPQGALADYATRHPRKDETPDGSLSFKKAAPYAKAKAKELGVDFESVEGTGKDGAVTVADVEAAKE